MKFGIACAIIALAAAPMSSAVAKEKSRLPVDHLTSSIHEKGSGFYKVEVGATNALMSVGKPPALSWYGSWITSDYAPDAFSTYFFWCDVESTAVVASFFSPSAANASGTVKVYNAAGTVVFTDEASGSPEGPSVYAAVIGKLPVGNYKVVIKVKQGKKSIGDQFWMSVYASSDPACSGLAE